jgi:hypothetical protein
MNMGMGLNMNLNGEWMKLYELIERMSHELILSLGVFFFSGEMGLIM